MLRSSVVASSSTIRALCPACTRRQLSTTSPLLVKRPQEPYPMPRSFIDAYGHNRHLAKGGGPDAYEADSRAEAHQQHLEAIAEGKITWSERYGSHEGFGLKNKPKYRVGSDGKLEAWEAAGPNWRRSLMHEEYSKRRLGLGIHGFQRREHPRLTPSGRVIRDEKQLGGPSERSESETGELEMMESEGQEGYEAEGSGSENRRWWEERIVEKGHDEDMPQHLQFAHTEENAGEPSQPVRPLRPQTRKEGLSRDVPPHQANFSASGPRSDGTGQQSQPPSDYARQQFPVREFYGSSSRSIPRAGGGRSSGAFGREGQGRPRDSGANYASNFGIRKYTTTAAGGRQFGSPRVVFEQHRSRKTSPSHAPPPSSPFSEIPTSIGEDQQPLPPRRPWKPAKKLSFSAMAGLKELHRTDPQTYDRKYLSEKFGISFEAVSRILKSSWRDRPEKPQVAEARPLTQSQALNTEEEVGNLSLRGTKWDLNSDSAPRSSPVPAILRAAKANEER